jgi:hypothetical protein
MRALLLPVALLAACAGGGETVQRSPDALDCTWIADRNNCWATMAKALDVCLGTPTDTGQLAPDLLSCAYPYLTTKVPERTIKATKPLAGAHDNPDPNVTNPPPPERDFTVTNSAGTECVHLQESDRVLTVSFAGSALRLSTQGGRIELTCPDGNVFKGDDASVRGCLSPSGGIPGYAWLTDLTEKKQRATFALLGMKAPLYACAVEKTPPK